MSFTYTKGILKISVAQICQNIGWHAVQTSPMEILIDIAHRYILELSKTVHRYSNQYGRTEPNLDDLALTFKDFNISLHEMEEYVNNVEPVPFVHKLGKFPAPHPSNLQHPKPGSKELSHRPDFIPDYMPPMHPEFDDEENVHSPNSIVDNTTKKTLTEASSAGGESPLGSPKHGVKRTLEWSGEAPPSKKAKHYPEEEGRPMREVTSVFMTPSGFISPAYEGKVAEPSLPQIMDSPPSTPEPVVHSADILPSKKEMKSKDSKKEKSSKSKKDKESSKKDSKKNKSSKKEKENKENAEISSEKGGNPSFSAKKEVNSHKSSGKSEKSLKIGDSGKPKSKGDKVKQKESKDDFKKYKDSSKLYKFKSKVNKHSGMSSNSPSKAIKSPKISKSPKLSKSPKNPKPSKSEKPKSPPLPPPCPAPSPPPPPPPIVNKEDSIEKNFPKVEVMEERPELKMEEILAEARYRDESPESRLIIDDSIEAQARQEMESRMADLDKCIEAVIQRATVQCEVEAKKTYREMDETINEVVRGPAVIKKQEPKDIYDFTDSSNGSRPDSPDMRNSPVTKMPVKKEKSSKTPEMTVKTPPSVSVVESPKKGKVKEKHKKKTVKEQKPKTSLLPKVAKETQGLFLMSPKPPKSSVPPVCVKQEEKVLPPLSPPIKREEVESDEDSTPCPSSLVTNIFGLRPPSTQRHLPSTPFSQLPPPPPFVPSPSPVMNFSPNPFQHMRLFPQHMQPNRFPTPPLFVDMSPRADMSTSFQASNNNNNNPQPLNLAKSDSNTQTKSTPEKQPSEPRSTSSQSTFSSEEVVDFRKKTEDVQHEKSKFKDHKKEKKEREKIDKKEKLKKKSKEKKEKEKEKEKEKSKEKKEEIKEKEKERDKPKEKQSKIKVEKVVKVEKKSKSKSDKEKKKLKEKEEKGKDDSPVPKMTLKLSSGTGAAKIFIKSSAKSAPSPVPPAPPSPPPRECQDSPSPPPTPPPPSAPPPRIPTPTPAPVKVATPPPVSAPPSPPPPSPPPPPKSPTPPSPSPVEELLPPAAAPPPPPPPPPPQPVISPASPTPAPAVAPPPPTPVAKATHSRSGRGRGRRAAAQQPVPPARTVITETIGTIVDESGNKIWICPTCTRPDDGSPMIGCDECDDWYHWVCVNIVVPPKEEESWFCERCITKRKTTPVKRRRKKHKRDK